jgi:hypothetical protein
MDNVENRQHLLEQERARPELAKMRYDCAFLVTVNFKKFGEMLWVSGHLIGTDRKDGLSPFQFGSDEVYGVALLMRIAAELGDNTIRLFAAQQTYAGAALLRQIVEIEYLSWAFDQRDGDAEEWLRSTKEERWEIFRPAKLRQSAGKTFRAKDYGYHCDLGGHPTPNALSLLNNDPLVTQLLMCDLLGHLSGIWRHFVEWGKQHQELETVFTHYQAIGLETGEKLSSWKAKDPLFKLGPPL